MAVDAAAAATGGGSTSATGRTRLTEIKGGVSA